MRMFPWSRFLVSATLVICMAGCGTGNFSAVLDPVAPAATVSLARQYWAGPAIGAVNQLGTITLPQGSSGSTTLLQPVIFGSNGPLVCTGSVWNAAGTQMTISYTLGESAVHVTVGVTMNGNSIQLELDADQATISSVDFGLLSQTLEAEALPVPYYTGNVWYSKPLGLYLNTWWDWRKTHAASQSATAVHYSAKTDGTLNLLHENLTVVASRGIDDVLPSPGNSTSPYLKQMAGRTVLDIWDVGFAGIAQGLSDLGDYGIGNCAAIIHDWQHAGYDNALPEHFTSNAGYGGDVALQAVIAQGKANGCLMAVHENYADYYPNYPLFSPAALAQNSDGSRLNAWFNPTTKIQSYAAKPTWMVANASTQSPQIHDLYGTNASYLDVHSAAPISSNVDMDHAVAGAGLLTAWTTGNQSLWTYERQTYNGPVLGEGAAHWLYSGLLDGVEAQLGAGVAQNSDAALPLFVDFDLLKIHPLQVNHGMGYYERWTKTGTTSRTTAEADAYRMQEIAFGHAPFLSNGTWSNVPQAMVESSLVGPVATSYGASAATSIEYQVNGNWADASVASQTQTFTQVQVAYANGLVAVANSSTTALPWKNLTIPQYGWAAEGPHLLAFTAQCGATLCDYAETPTSVFANSRNQADAIQGWGYAAPSVASLQQTGVGSFHMTLNWNAYRQFNATAGLTVFVHFVNDSLITASSEGIVFQGDHLPASPATQWIPGQMIADGPFTVEVPSSLPDGTYSIRVGLYDPATQVRMAVSGQQDANLRVLVGYVTVQGGGMSIRFSAPASVAADPRLNASDGVANFPTVQTDGMISITQENGQWRLVRRRFRNRRQWKPWEPRRSRSRQ
jgi:hypothetical protein